MADGKDTLKDWIRSEMVSTKDEDQNLVVRTLSNHKDEARGLFAIRQDGKITIQKPSLTGKSQILAYLIGAVYSKAGEAREDDAVSNKELIEELHMPEGSVKSALSGLRKNQLAIQKSGGLHRINYKKLPEIMSVINGGAK